MSIQNPYQQNRTILITQNEQKPFDFSIFIPVIWKTIKTFVELTDLNFFTPGLIPIDNFKDMIQYIIFNVYVLITFVHITSKYKYKFIISQSWKKREYSKAIFLVAFVYVITCFAETH